MVTDSARTSVSRLAAASLLILGLSVAWCAAPRVALAAPTSLFVKVGGSGSACTQAQPCDLPTALDKAIDADTIYLAQGTYVGSGSQAVVTFTKSLSLYGGWDGSADGPVVPNAFANPTVLDGEGARRLVHLSPGISATLEGFTITRGSSEPGWGRPEGATLVLRAIAASETDPIEARRHLRLRGSARSWVTRDRTTRPMAAGLRLINEPPSPSPAPLEVNRAEISGGAIDADCCGGAHVVVAGNIIAGNHGANLGGGVLVQSTQMTLHNNILINNEATRGSNVCADGTSDYPAAITAVNNTLAGGGVSGEGLWVDSYVTATLVNNIIAGHGVGIPVPSAQSTVSAEYNLLWNDDDPYTGTNPVLADPRLDSGHHLTGLSPARNAGRVVDLDVDIDGDTRPLFGGYDIGADEYIAEIYLPLLTKP